MGESGKGQDPNQGSRKFSDTPVGHTPSGYGITVCVAVLPKNGNPVAHSTKRSPTRLAIGTTAPARSAMLDRTATIGQLSRTTPTTGNTSTSTQVALTSTTTTGRTAIQSVRSPKHLHALCRPFPPCPNEKPANGHHHGTDKDRPVPGVL